MIPSLTMIVCITTWKELLSKVFRNLPFSCFLILFLLVHPIPFFTKCSNIFCLPPTSEIPSGLGEARGEQSGASIIFAHISLVEFLRLSRSAFRRMAGR